MSLIRYLLDTNTASYIIKGNRPSISKRLLRVPMAEVGISAVTEAELRFGLSKRPEATRLKTVVQEFLLRVEALPWDSAAAKEYATVRAELEREGAPMGNLDMMIAAQSLARGATLVTNDKAFQRVPGLTISDWSKP